MTKAGVQSCGVREERRLWRCGEGADPLYQNDTTAPGKVSSRDDKPLLTETLTHSAGRQWNWHCKCKPLHVAVGNVDRARYERLSSWRSLCQMN